MKTRTYVHMGPYVNGRQVNVPCPPATNGILIQVRPEDTPEARMERQVRVRATLCPDGSGRVHSGAICACQTKKMTVAGSQVS